MVRKGMRVFSDIVSKNGHIYTSGITGLKTNHANPFTWQNIWAVESGSLLVFLGVKGLQRVDKVVILNISKIKKSVRFD